MTKRAFAVNLRKARRAKNWIQKQAADATGIKPKSYAKYEEGLCEPDAERLVHMAEIFGVHNLKAWIMDPNFDMDNQDKPFKANEGSPLQSNFAKVEKVK